MSYSTKNPRARNAGAESQNNARATLENYSQVAPSPQLVWIEAGGPRYLIKGRNAWALLRLIAPSSKSVTPKSELTGPRLSAYVFNLKRQYGLDIETVTENHGGPYAGNHARYVLRERVVIISIDGEQV